jgi:hypothetical protein
MSLSGPPWWYAIHLLSGLQAGRLPYSGALSAPSNVVSALSLAPAFGSIAKMSQLSVRSMSAACLLTKAIVWPSGDQDGRSSLASPEVSASERWLARSTMNRWLRFLPRYPVMSSLNWNRSMTIGLAAFFFFPASLAVSPASVSASWTTSTSCFPSGDQS